jgi:hypothetical protein
VFVVLLGLLEVCTDTLVHVAQPTHTRQHCTKKERGAGGPDFGMLTKHSDILLWVGGVMCAMRLCMSRSPRTRVNTAARHGCAGVEGAGRGT